MSLMCRSMPRPAAVPSVEHNFAACASVIASTRSRKATRLFAGPTLASASGSSSAFRECHNPANASDASASVTTNRPVVNGILPQSSWAVNTLSLSQNRPQEVIVS